MDDNDCYGYDINDVEDDNDDTGYIDIGAC